MDAAPAAREAPAPPRDTFAGDEITDLLRGCLRRLGGLQAVRSPYEPAWRELSDYIAPTRGRLSATSPQPGDTRRARPDRARILDRSATKAMKDLAAFLQRGITSPARPWFRLQVPDQDTADEGEVRAWLDEVRVRMMAVFSASNFYLAMANLYEELPTFGTAAVIIVQDYDDVIRCHPLTIGEFWIGCDQRGRADTIYRQYAMSAAQLEQRFGKANLSLSARQALEDGHPDREFAVCHAIEPNPKRSKKALGWRGMPYRSVWWELGRETERALSVSGFHRFPAIAPRWDVVANDTYGHGPGADALPDVKSLQHLQLRRAEAVDKIVKPPLVAPAQMQGSQISVIPGAINFLPGTQGAKLEPLYAVPPNLASLETGIADTRQLIRETFRADLISMFADSDRREMTAAEVRARQEEKMLLLGPMLERFHDEALTPAIEILFDIMTRGGLLPEIPEALRGRYVAPDYVSLLAQAQKATDTAMIERTAGFIGNLAQAVPEVLDKLNTDEAVDQYNALIGGTPRIVRSDDEVAKIREARAAAAAQAQQLEAAQQIASLTQQGAQGAKLLSETRTGAGASALDVLTGV